MKIYYCKEKNCNNKICKKTALYGQGRCCSCSKKGKRNHLFGKHHTKKSKTKISKTRKGKIGKKLLIIKMEIL